jgi:hypothetical protein
LRQSRSDLDSVDRILAAGTAIQGLHSPLTVLANGWDTVTAKMLAAAIHPTYLGAGKQYATAFAEPFKFAMNLARQPAANVDGMLRGVESMASAKDVARRTAASLKAGDAAAKARGLALEKSATGGYLKENMVNSGDDIAGAQTRTAAGLNAVQRAFLWGMKHSVHSAKVQTWLTGAELFQAIQAKPSASSWATLEKLGYRGSKDNLGEFADWFTERIGGRHGKNSLPEVLRDKAVGATVGRFMGYSMNQLGIYGRLAAGAAGASGGDLATRTRMAVGLASIIGATVFSGGAINAIPGAKALADAADMFTDRIGGTARKLEEAFGSWFTHSMVADLLPDGIMHDLAKDVGERVGVGGFGGGVPGIEIPVAAGKATYNLLSGVWKKTMGSPAQAAEAEDDLATAGRTISPYGYKLTKAITGDEIRSASGKPLLSDTTPEERIELGLGVNPKRLREAREKAQILAPQKTELMRSLTRDLADAVVEKDNARIQRRISEYRAELLALADELKSTTSTRRKAEIAEALKEMGPETFAASLKTQIMQRQAPGAADLTKGSPQRKALAAAVTEEQKNR